MKTLLRNTLLSLTTVVCLHMGGAQTAAVKTGIEVLRERGFDILQGKRVGLITNQTGVDSRLISTVDILFKAGGVKLVALFGPEHGVRGDMPAGMKVDSSIDAGTHLPVYSLYGITRKPTPGMLKGIDVLVYDIQDIGCRSYTYISTMGLAMEAAAENKIAFVVLDRPNPLGGLKIEGNIVEEGYRSFVIPYPIPYIYGLTCGELARMLNGEKMLTGGEQCSLTVVPMEGWKRRMSFAETGLPWVPSSPHIPAMDSPEYCAGSGLLGELGVISEGVGYTLPFRVFAAPWIDAQRLVDILNGFRLDGVLFRPMTFTPFYGRFAGKELHGAEFYVTDAAGVNLISLQFLFMEAHHRLYPAQDPLVVADSSRIAMFDREAGTEKVRKLFTRRMIYSDVREFLQKDVAPFRERSKAYYLY